MKYTLAEHASRVFKTPIERAVQDNAKLDPEFRSRFDHAITVLEKKLQDLVKTNGLNIKIDRPYAVKQMVFMTALLDRKGKHFRDDLPHIVRLILKADFDLKLPNSAKAASHSIKLEM